MKFKVCGLFNNKNIQEVSELNPDYIGHIFWKKSVRYVKDSTPRLKKGIKKTGVFFNSSIEYVYNKIEDHELKCVQLHGKENDEYIIDGSSYKGIAPVDFLIGTWWNHDIVGAKAQISAVSGRIIKQKVKFLGKDKIKLAEKELTITPTVKTNK